MYDTCSYVWCCCGGCQPPEHIAIGTEHTFTYANRHEQEGSTLAPCLE